MTRQTLATEKTCPYHPTHSAGLTHLVQAVQPGKCSSRCWQTLRCPGRQVHVAQRPYRPALAERAPRGEARPRLHPTRLRLARTAGWRTPQLPGPTRVRTKHCEVCASNVWCHILTDPEIPAKGGQRVAAMQAAGSRLNLYCKLWLR